MRRPLLFVLPLSRAVTGVFCILQLDRSCDALLDGCLETHRSSPNRRYHGQRIVNRIES